MSQKPVDVDKLIDQLSDILNCNLITLRKLRELEKSDNKEKLDSFIDIMKEHEKTLVEALDRAKQEKET